MFTKVRNLWQRAREARRRAGDRGMSTAEYAVGTLAAVMLATVLYKIVSSGAVSDEMRGLIMRALSGPF
ncbi:DUF4244 domain-containing protein [Streptomyces axinellae]